MFRERNDGKTESKGTFSCSSVIYFMIIVSLRTIKVAVGMRAQYYRCEGLSTQYMRGQ